MSRFRIDFLVFLAGLAAVLWTGIGYIASNPLALAVTLLIGACYVIGALELWRFSQDTAALDTAVSELAAPPATLNAWLERVPAGLRGAVRLRVESERAALPGPALTPYLVGLLVLLGMFGTLLGMAATLKGTGAALEGSTDLLAIRASLAAPVKGLAFAFGTSIAGVATSAMLGLLSALCRRARAEAAQRLDAKIATTLRGFSQAHQREAGFAVMRRQAEAMPAIVERLQTVIAAIEQQSVAMNERQIASQTAFLGKAEATWTALAASVARSLQDNAASSARAASAAVLPAVEATLAKLKEEAATLHGTVTQAVERQLNGVSEGLEATTASVRHETTRLHDAVAQAVERQLSAVAEKLDASTATLRSETASLHETVTQAVERQLGAIATGFDSTAARFSQETATLQGTVTQAVERQLGAITTGFDSTVSRFSQETAALQGTVTQAVERQLGAITTNLDSTAARFSQETAALQGAVTQAVERQLSAITTGFDSTAARFSQETAALQSTVTQAVERQLSDITTGLAATSAGLSEQWRDALAQQREQNDTLAADLRASLDRYAETFAQRSAELLSGVAARLDTTADTVSQTWTAAHAQHAQVSEQLALAHQQALTAAAGKFDEHTAALLRAADESHAALQAELTAREQQRLDAWRETVATMTTALHAQWNEALAQAASRQQTICETLERTAGEVAATTSAHSRETIAEIARLVQAASQAPLAAAEVVAELRQKLSESMVRDTAMLEERSRLLATLETLLDAVNHASTEQRSAVDALVSTSADLLDRVGTRFTERVETQAHKLDGIAAQVASGGAEVASLADAFGAAVQSFGTSNETLVAQLQRIEGSLDKSLARSDEQLAYYVAQAREVIDLSLLSQKQIMEELQQLASQRAEAGAEAGADAA
ncbi:DUF802 domain-containing protein [Paraburkholderia ferrariae]|uniref:DUF802 domain-containing protein n=1 Tax=Paraburkholderia ferrariae TaxID=386056 RepID=UPI000487C9DE|nr:DUF802 domain-containing protein [Paraburkholderia ferrariae]